MARGHRCQDLVERGSAEVHEFQTACPGLQGGPRLYFLPAIHRMGATDHIHACGARKERQGGFERAPELEPARMPVESPVGGPGRGIGHVQRQDRDAGKEGGRVLQQKLHSFGEDGDDQVRVALAVFELELCHKPPPVRGIGIAPEIQ